MKDRLYALTERMKRGDTPQAANNPLAYGNTLVQSLEDMPKMSDKHATLVAEAVFAAYQLGQLRMQILRDKVDV